MLGKQATDVISKNQGGGRGEEAQLQIICFSFFLSSSKMFLSSETRRQGLGLAGRRGGWGGMLIASPLVHGSQKRPRPALQEHRAVRVSH